MDGVVVVAERGGALQYARSLGARFDRLHAKSERLNLAALLFALQQFAANSVHDSAADGPPIAVFETAAERIVMARSRARGLLIALFMRPSVDTDVAQSLVGRIAYYYDHDLGVESRLAVALNQNARIFREACEKAIQDQVDACLHEFAASVYGQYGAHRTSATGFVLFHYSPSRSSRQRQDQPGNIVFDDGDYDEDDNQEDIRAPTAIATSNENAKESRLASPRPTGSVNPAEPAPRLQKLFASTRSLLPQPKVGGRGHGAHTGKLKQNAVMPLEDPKHFERFVRFPGEDSSTGGRADETPLGKLVGHPQFPLALVDALAPHMTHLVELMQPPTHSASVTRTVEHASWRNFPLPSLGVGTRVGAHLALCFRDGCFLVHVDAASTSNASSEKLRVASLLDRVAPLARCAVKLSS